MQFYYYVSDHKRQFNWIWEQMWFTKVFALYFYDETPHRNMKLKYFFNFLITKHVDYDMSNKFKFESLYLHVVYRRPGGSRRVIYKERIRQMSTKGDGGVKKP